MRISTNMMFDRNLNNMGKTTSRLDRASEQMYTGEKFKVASEDPAGMAQKLGLTSEIELFKQYSTNGGLLQGSLSLEESVLDSLNTVMSSAYTKVQQSMNGAHDATDKEAIATELEELQKHMFDLMNSKNASGEYIFGGNQSQTQPFIKDSSGIYQFQGDSGQRFVQVSPSVRIASNDSGLELFQAVPTRRTATANTANITTAVTDQGQFDTFYRTRYDPVTAANNTYTVNTLAGTPPQYEIRNAGGTLMQSGDYTQGVAISFNGLELKVNVVAPGAAQTFDLTLPKNDNILNTMSDMIAALRDPALTPEQFKDVVADTEVHLNKARDTVNVATGHLGGRMNNLDDVLNSNEGLTNLNQESRATVSEIDLYEAISNVTKENSALTIAQQAYTMVNKTTLFSYL